MKRWVWSVLLTAVMMALLVGSAMAAEVVVGGIRYEGNKVVGPVESNRANITTAKIESIVNNVTITEIGDKAFDACVKLTTVELPDTITTIGVEAFNGCGVLSNIKIPDKVISIGTRAFTNCAAMRSFALPAALKEITSYTFQGCTNLTDFYIPSGKVAIQEDAFLGCTRLKILHCNIDTKSEPPDQQCPDDKKLTVHFAATSTTTPEPASCAKEGLERFVAHCYEGCNRDIYTKDNVLAKTNHKPEDIIEVDAVAATCVSTGHTAGKQCTLCGEATEGMTEIPIDENNHVNGMNDISAVDATCTTAGSTAGKQCPDCGKYDPEPQEIKPLGHTHTTNNEKSDWRTVRAATCMLEGIQVKDWICDRCDEVIPCETCEENEGKELTDAFIAHLSDPDKHAEVENIATPPHKLGEAEFVFLSDLDENAPADKPTCIADGKKTKVRRCQNEGCTYHEVVNGTDGNPITENVPKTDHTIDPDVPVTDETVTAEATCTKEGTKAFKARCKVCGMVYDGEEKIPATGHKWGVPDLEIKPATCEEAGSTKKTYTCLNENCDDGEDEEGHTGTYEEIDPIGPTGHKWGEYKITSTVIEPTCKPGKAIGEATCQVCNKTESGIEIELEATAAHQYGEWTTGEDGKIYRVCSVCGDRQEGAGTSEPDNPDTPDNPDNPDTPGDPDTPTPPTDSTYNINISSSSYGSVTSSVYSAERGDRVTLTVRPDSGYELDWIRVTTSGGSVVTLDGLGGGQYRFTMPSSNVEVRSSFTQVYTPSWSTNTSTSTGATSRWTEPSQTVVQGVPRAGASSQLFSDIPVTHWAAGEINWAYNMGYMSGNRGRFNPNGTITFQQMWMVLARISGSRPAGMADAREWAVLNGFAEGGNPTHTVARHQLVTALYRCAHIMGSTNHNTVSLAGYPDSRTVPTVARDPMAWAVANGIIGGNANGRLDPFGTMTRAQFAVILYRFSQRI